MSTVLLGFYKAIEESSRKMLEAAREEDWDGVVRYEGTCAVLIEQLRFRAKSETLDAQARLEKTGIMQRILRNDAHIRDLAEPWLNQCNPELHGSQLLH
jgi:flagellar protein FliT